MQHLETISEVLDSWLGGALTTLFGAGAGRLMYHAREVRKRKRRFFGRELVWELPIAFGMAIIGEAATSYLRFEQPVSTGMIAALAYLGPRGVEIMLVNWLARKEKQGRWSITVCMLLLLCFVDRHLEHIHESQHQMWLGNGYFIM